MVYIHAQCVSVRFRCCLAMVVCFFAASFVKVHDIYAIMHVPKTRKAGESYTSGVAVGLAICNLLQRFHCSQLPW